MIDQGAWRAGLSTQLGDTETCCHGGKGGTGTGTRFGIWQVELNALHHFGKGQVTRSIVGDDVYQPGSPLPHALRSARYYNSTSAIGMDATSGTDDDALVLSRLGGELQICRLSTGHCFFNL